MATHLLDPDFCIPEPRLHHYTFAHVALRIFCEQKHSKNSYVNNGNHINGLEGFWGYLKRKLAAKGGIRAERLHLYLGEYVWRYNHRHLNLKEQQSYLLKLLKMYIRSG